MEKIKVIVMGAGSRGKTYTDLMKTQEDHFQVVGVAEPIADRRDYIKNKHGIAAENCFDTWEKILAVPKFADVAIISTMDRDHYLPAMKALELGYDLLLEKPVAPTAKECVDIKNQAEKYGRKVMVCHVLRYTNFYMGLKKVLDSGEIGDILDVTHSEAVGPQHQSHSFVRGNWGNEERSSFMLLQKSCHDLDILQWLLNKKCKNIQSFGSIKYFKSENAPAGSPEYCIDGCPATDKCIFNAVKLYLDDKDNYWFRSTATKKTEPTDEDVEKALRTTQYGKCVFKCDNDVVDHQTVNIEFTDKTTATFTMCAFDDTGRTTKILGTKGMIEADMDKDTIRIKDFLTKETKELHTSDSAIGGSIVEGHGGGDPGIVHALYDYISGKKDRSQVSEIGISCENHMMVFAAEKSRLENDVVDVEKYMAEVYR